MVGALPGLTGEGASPARKDTLCGRWHVARSTLFFLRMRWEEEAAVGRPRAREASEAAGLGQVLSTAAGTAVAVNMLKKRKGTFDKVEGNMHTFHRTGL